MESLSENKKMNKTISSCIPLAVSLILSGSLNASDLTDILPLTSKIIMLRFDDGYIKHYGYHQTDEILRDIQVSP